MSAQETCAHRGTERVTRVAHGYLGDAPVGTVQTLCVECGTELVRNDASAVMALYAG